MTHIFFTDWGAWLEDRATEAELDETRRRTAWAGAKRRWDVSADSSSELAPPGDQRLKVIRTSLDSFEGFARSDAQKRFHVSFLQSLLPHIYGPADFERYRDRILHENNMREVQYDTLVCTPRRFGKTTSIAMLCATLLAICPDM
jgi:hypothetical protein